MRKYQNLKDKKKGIMSETKGDLKNLDTVGKESLRVAEVAKHSVQIIDDLDLQFEKETKLNQTDISFLFFATALQCFRQYFLTDFKERLGDQESAKEFTKKEKEIFDKHFIAKEHEDSKRYSASLEDIINKGVPYDATWGSRDFHIGGEDKGLGGRGHRFKTLGHDPLLGWLFGTANIMTRTLTDWKFSTYHVRIENMTDGRPMYKIVNNGSTKLMLDKMWARAKLEPEVLAAAVIKQSLHIKSDEYSTVGLPLPIISTISPEIAQKLAKQGLDYGNIKIIGKQATVSIMINTLIGMIHSLYYDETKYTSPDLYKVKTRKILSYSNLIASSSNVIYVALSKEKQKLDLGGMMVTLYRLLQDRKFIRQVKQEFLEKEFHNIVIGEDYTF